MQHTLLQNIVMGKAGKGKVFHAAFNTSKNYQPHSTNSVPDTKIELETPCVHQTFLLDYLNSFPVQYKYAYFCIWILCSSNNCFTMPKLIREWLASSGPGTVPAPRCPFQSPAASESDGAISLTHCRVTPYEVNGLYTITGHDTLERAGRL